MNSSGANRYVLALNDAVPPTGSSYWVVQDVLLAGAYPGDPDPKKHPMHVQAILDAGIRSFINLMEESEKNNSGEKFHPYDAHFGRFAAHVVCRRHPIRDVNIPTHRQMTAILDDIDASLGQGKPVYVHCWGGRGRTGTVIGCWMLRHRLATPDNLLKLLKQLRRQDRKSGQFRSPETDLQCDFVTTWHE